jgi:RNA polymerase sigma factor (sigma-70 family)
MANPQGYAFRIAVNLSRSWFRRKVRERRALARLDTTGVSDEPATAERLATRSAMLALPRRQREVVLLRYFAGMDVAETAEAMGCTAGTVKAHTHRAMARLREQLQVSEEPRP